MKCIKGVMSGEVFRTSERHAAELVLFNAFEYVPKAEWKRGGRKRSGPQDQRPSSVHPRAGSPPRHGKTRGRW